MRSKDADKQCQSMASCILLIIFQLEVVHRQLVGEIDSLRAKVKALWDRLEVGGDERKSFCDKHADLCPKTANAVSISTLLKDFV